MWVHQRRVSKTTNVDVRPQHLATAVWAPYSPTQTHCPIVKIDHEHEVLQQKFDYSFILSNKISNQV